MSAVTSAFVYVRVSTREQARTGGGEEGYSIPAQRTASLDKAQQLGAVVTGVYIDAGESAKTANRPELQRLLKDVKKHRPTYVIVHKIDRLARNREDDIAINLTLKKAGVTLVSCSENVTDTPSGRFLYNIMADMAQFYSDNLAQEVLKGMQGKARDGGTPTRAPTGYLHKRDFLDGVLASWVVVDPERAPLIRWAFGVYATGDWTLEGLAQALREKGLTIRRGPKTPEREISFNALNKILRNPYYMGVVTFQGATYEGKHEALVDPETWLRVQDVMQIRAHRGEKERKHPHYLRGSIYCGSCGERLIYSRNTGRGGTYEYYICGKKRVRSLNCPSSAVRLEKIEAGIAALYQQLQLPPEAEARLRLGVQAELANETADAHEQAERANRQLSAVAGERTKILQAHYAGAVPLDLLKTEMERLTRAMTAAEREVKFARAGLADTETILEQALMVAANCSRHYEAAPPFIRRQMNQGFFKRLLIERDGTIQRVELTEPFEALLNLDLNNTAAQDGGSDNGAGASSDRPSPRPILIDIITESHHLITDGGSLGSHKRCLVELRGFEPLTP
ncbi:MAG: recombinase family protein [Pseudonocardia sp.]